jgi:hypothetical protein
MSMQEGTQVVTQDVPTRWEGFEVGPAYVVFEAEIDLACGRAKNIEEL